MSPPVQELPNAHKLVRLYCLPLRGRRGHVPALQGLFRLLWCVFRVWIARALASVAIFCARLVVPARDCHGALRLAMTGRVAFFVIAMKVFVGWGHVPTGAGTSDCVQTCSFVPSAATRTARPVVVPYECGMHSRRRARTRKGYAASVTLLRRERLR